MSTIRIHTPEVGDPGPVYPLAIVDYGSTIPTRTIVHELLGEGVVVVPRPSGPRRGRFLAVFRTDALAHAAVELLERQRMFVLEGSLTTLNMPRFAVTGELEVSKDDTLDTWGVLVNFQEAPL